jgi:hypothetical protein
VGHPTFLAGSHHAFNCFLVAPLKPDRFCFFYALLKPRILAAPEPEKGVRDALRFTRFSDCPPLLNKMADANKYAER